MSENVPPADVLSQYWATNYVGPDGRCLLCCNSGFIALPGMSVYCFCPNGRELRARGERVSTEVHDSPCEGIYLRTE